MNAMRGARKGVKAAGPPPSAKGEPKPAGPAAAASTKEGPHFSNQELTQIRSSLIQWYDQVHRVLPWRRNPHSRRAPEPEAGPGAEAAPAPAPASLSPQQFAYQVWVSEVMLQQTQVVKVIPYFTKWVARWPTVADLASATVEEVNAMWAGLGYYRRARYLLDGSKYVVEKLGGSFPTTAKELQQVPGVGPYTSAAVASIAFNDPSAVVDGNVVRVVSRLRALAGDPTKLGHWHTAMAQEMLDLDRPGCFNQAVMELGATVCRPVNPDCDACPVQQSCRAHEQWRGYLQGGGQPDIEDAPRVTLYPGKKPVKDKREESVAVCVLEVVVTGGAGGGGQGKQPGGAAAAAEAAKGKPAVKRQRTMFDFVGPAAATAGPAAGALGERWLLLLRRPDHGLLAGLWEFPGVEFDGELTRSGRQDLVSGLLERLLGVPFPPPSASDTSTSTSTLAPGHNGMQLVSRHDMGSFVHIFSHIRQTSYVEKALVAVDSLERLQECAAAAAAAAEAGASAPVGDAPGAQGQGEAEEGGEDDIGGDEEGRMAVAAKGKTQAASRQKGAQKGKKAGGRKAAAAAEQERGPALAWPQLRWIRAGEVSEAGLNTLAVKVYAQVSGDGAAGGKSGGSKRSKA